MSTGPEVLYVNANSVAGNQAQSAGAVVADLRSVPIVNKSDDYRMGVSRFTVQGHELPLFIPQIQLGQSDPTRTVYAVAVTMTYGSGASQQSFTASAPIYWRPHYSDEPVPPAPLTQQLLTSRYYWAQDYAHVVGLINAAWAQAMAVLTVQFNIWYVGVNGAGAIPPALVAAPALQYNRTDGSFTFGATAASGSQAYTYLLNEPLRQLLSFPATSIYRAPISVPGGNVAQQNSRWYGIALSSGPITIGGVQYPSQSTTERDTREAWSPISALVFVTALPIISEQSSAPNLLGSDDSMQGATNYQGTVLTDFALPLTNGAGDYLQAITYSPYIQRWSQLTSPEPLTSVVVRLYWRNRFDSDLYPVTLGPSGTISLKLILQRKW